MILLFCGVQDRVVDLKSLFSRHGCYVAYRKNVLKSVLHVRHDCFSSFNFVSGVVVASTAFLFCWTMWTAGVGKQFHHAFKLIQHRFNFVSNMLKPGWTKGANERSFVFVPTYMVAALTLRKNHLYYKKDVHQTSQPIMAQSRTWSSLWTRENACDSL